MFFWHSKTLENSNFKDIDFSAEHISHPALKVLIKFCNHPSVSAIRNAFNLKNFSFSKLNVYVFREIKKLGNRKAIQRTNTPVKTLKQNADIWKLHLSLF